MCIRDSKYGPKKAKVINGIRRISKPGLRKYTGVADMPRVRGGLGLSLIHILSHVKGALCQPAGCPLFASWACGISAFDVDARGVSYGYDGFRGGITCLLYTSRCV